MNPCVVLYSEKAEWMIFAYYARCYGYMMILHCFDEVAIIDELSLMFDANICTVIMIYDLWCELALEMCFFCR